MVNMQNASVGESYRLQNLDEARVLMDTVSKDLRTATRLSSTSSPFDVTAGSVPAPGFGNTAPYAGNTEVWFYANLTLTTRQPTPCPDVVHLYVDTAASPPVLKEQTISAQAGGRPAELHVHGELRDAPGGQVRGELRRARRSSPTTTTTRTASPPRSRRPRPRCRRPTGCSSTRWGSRSSIRQSNNFNVPFTTLVNKVRLPNVDYNPLPSP